MIQERLLGELRFREDEHGWALDVGLRIGLAGCVNASQDVPSKVPHRLATVDFKRLTTEINQRLAEREIETQLPTGLCDPQSWNDALDRTLNAIQKDVSPVHRAFVMIGFACSCLAQAKRAETIAPEYGKRVYGMAKVEVAHLRRFCPTAVADRFDTGALIAALLPAATADEAPEQVLRDLFREWQRPMTVLLVQSDPTDKNRLRLSEHHQRMAETLAASLYRSGFEIHVIANARPELLGPKMAELRPTIVHFSGHSTAAGVVMSDPVGKAVDISPSRLARLLALARRDRLRGIVMNACYTADQLSADAKGLGQVVVMEGLLADNAAIRFSQQFYAYLGTGLSFEQSFEWASVSADLADLEGRLQPKFLNV